MSMQVGLNWDRMLQYADAIRHLQNIQYNLVEIIEDFLKGNNDADVELRARLLLIGVGMDYVTGTGQVLSNVHSPDACADNDCPIHNPSIHNMVGWPTYFREDTGVMERICKHGIGHPDPDDPQSKHEVHGCCGCCK